MNSNGGSTANPEIIPAPPVLRDAIAVSILIGLSAKYGLLIMDYEQERIITYCWKMADQMLVARQLDLR